MRPALRIASMIATLVFALPQNAAQGTAEPKPFARTELQPGRVVTVGQPTTLIVEVLVPSWFTGAPRFPDLDVDDAIAVFNDRGANFTERIDGVTWAGQSRSYSVYPQRPGAYEIASIPVRVRYMAEGIGPGAEVRVSPPAVRFEARVPPEAEGLPYFISATRLDLEQSFDREPEKLKVGEAFTRTITVTVRDALSMVVPPIPADPIPGLAVYAEPPVVKDEGGERGERIIGTRVERATYIAEKEGHYSIPAIEITWWDFESRRLKTATLPPTELYVESNPDLEAAIPLPPEDLVEEQAETTARPRISLVELVRRWGVPLLGTVLLLVVVSRLWRRYVPGLRRRVHEAREERRESESAYFAKFRAAARSGDPRATWNAWASWLDRVHAGPGAATIRGFVDAARDEDLERELAALDAALFTAGSDREVRWSGRVLERTVARIRRRGAVERTRTEAGLFASVNPIDDSGRPPS